MSSVKGPTQKCLKKILISGLEITVAKQSYADVCHWVVTEAIISPIPC
jgi:hypothetical protein